MLLNDTFGLLNYLICVIYLLVDYFESVLLCFKYSC